MVHEWTTYSTSVRETCSWGGPGAPSRGFFSLCITIYRRKNQNCKKRQWCLWRFMCPLSMHQFIKISICALENKINSNISMSSDPWNSVRQPVFPCTAAETIGRTKLPSFFGRLGTILRAQACKRAHLHTRVKLCSLDPLAYQKNHPIPSGGVVFYGNWTCFVHYNIGLNPYWAA